MHFSILIIIFLIIILFCKVTLQYIYDRHKERKMLTIDNDDDNDNDNDNDDDNIYDIEKWLKRNGNSNSNIINKDSRCKEMVVEVDDDENNCKEISQKLCDGNVTMKKINIPSNSQIEFYSHSGVKLMNGKSYCIYKPPPPLLFDDDNSCNETWGFWQYSLKNERWQCKSKVPGIYNADKNDFDPCSKGKGLLYYKNTLIPKEKITRYFSPERFLEKKFQDRFKCKCPAGYVFREDLSRTTCFKDPCLANLPPYHAQTPGYNVETGNCLCGKFFTNLYPNNPKSPCTACPDAPSWDSKTNTLTIYVKCSKHFPCILPEDRTRGCLKARVGVKPMVINDKTSFEDLIFF